MVALFDEAGFIVDTSETRRWDQLPLNKKALSDDFSSLPENELIVSEFDVLLRKHL